MGDKLAQNILDAIERSRKGATLTRFIYALGIRHIGEAIAKTLAGHFKSIDEFMNATPAELQEVPEIGPIVTESIKQFFANPGNREVIKKLKEAGLNPRLTKKTGGKLNGQIFVFTGELTKYSRHQAKELVESLGGQTAESVGKKVNYVVAGPGAGEKLTKAKELGVTVLSEEQFLKMVGK
jgi:DNA ligase (NAD+)